MKAQIQHNLRHNHRAHRGQQSNIARDQINHQQHRAQQPIIRLNEMLFTVHSSFAIGLYVPLGHHIAGALKYDFLDGDAIFRRIWPSER